MSLYSKDSSGEEPTQIDRSLPGERELFTPKSTPQSFIETPETGTTIETVFDPSIPGIEMNGTINCLGTRNNGFISIPEFWKDVYIIATLVVFGFICTVSST